MKQETYDDAVRPNTFYRNYYKNQVRKIIDYAENQIERIQEDVEPKTQEYADGFVDALQIVLNMLLGR